MQKIKVFVATVKPLNIQLPTRYIPIQCGSANNQEMGYLRDDQGRNISKKNPNYCELTAVFYIWKNIKNTDIVGLCHHRRYFFSQVLSLNTNNILTEKKIIKLMKKYDVILPTRYYFNKKVKDNYAEVHHINDLLECGKIIKQIYPDYIDAFNKVLKRRWLYCFNMLIMKKKDFDNYCQWLFDILFELEKRVDISSYDNYNKRIYGFISERLLNVYMKKNKPRIKELPVYNIDCNKLKQILGIIKRKMLKALTF